MTGIIAPAGTSAIERTLDFTAAPERVWRALTDDAELSGWFGARCRLEVRVGGDGMFEWPEHGQGGVRFAARVEAVEPGVRLAWRWARESDTQVDAGPSTLVEWTLEPRPNGGTRLRMRETGFTEPHGRTENAHGWQHELGELAAFVAAARHEAGIRRTWTLRASRDEVWAAFTDPARLAAWWTKNPSLEVAPGAEGWMLWPEHGGRFAIRFELMEPPTALCWSWVTDAEIAIGDATQVLRTEWTFTAREDGGTDLTLLETGFTSEHEFAMNDAGWDEVLGGMRAVVGEG